MTNLKIKSIGQAKAVNTKAVVKAAPKKVCSGGVCRLVY